MLCLAECESASRHLQRVAPELTKYLAACAIYLSMTCSVSVMIVLSPKKERLGGGVRVPLCQPTILPAPTVLLFN